MSDAVELAVAGTGVRLRLRVKPGGRRNRLVGVHGGALKLEVQAPPERGKANAAVEKLLAAALGVGRAQVEIVSGNRSQDKVALVREVSLGELSSRLQQLGIDCGGATGR